MSRIAGIIKYDDEGVDLQSALDLMNPLEFPTHVFNLNQLQFGFVINLERKSELNSKSILENNEEGVFSKENCFINADIRLG